MLGTHVTARSPARLSRSGTRVSPFSGAPAFPGAHAAAPRDPPWSFPRAALRCTRHHVCCPPLGLSNRCVDIYSQAFLLGLRSADVPSYDPCRRGEPFPAWTSVSLPRAAVRAGRPRRKDAACRAWAGGTRGDRAPLPCSVPLWGLPASSPPPPTQHSRRALQPRPTVNPWLVVPF